MSDDERKGPVEERLEWIERALEETREWVERERTEAKGELATTAPGSPTSAYESDLVRLTRNAEETIAALELERDRIEEQRERWRQEAAEGG